MRDGWSGELRGRFMLCLTAGLAALLLSGCVKGLRPSDASAISASASSVRVGGTVTIKATSFLAGSTLSFAVNGVPGGNDQTGRITIAGLYTAPAVVPTPDPVTITATSSLAPGSPHSLSIQILNPVAMPVSVTPGSFLSGTATPVAVAGTQFVRGAQIFWNGMAVPTTFVSATQLTAVLTAPAPGTFSLMVSNPYWARCRRHRSPYR